MSNPLSQTKLCTSLWRCTQTCLAYFEKADFMTTLNTYWALSNGATWRPGATAPIIPITLIHGCLTCLWKFMAFWLCPQDHHISWIFSTIKYIWSLHPSVSSHHRMQLPSSQARQPATRPTPFPPKPWVSSCLFSCFLSLVKRAPLPQLFT